MPIHIGTSTKNQQEIALGTTKYARVYVGSALVWQKFVGRYTPNQIYLTFGINGYAINTIEFARSAAMDLYTGQYSLKSSATAYGNSLEVGDTLYWGPNIPTNFTTLADGFFIFMGNWGVDLPKIYIISGGSGVVSEIEIQWY